MRKLPRERLSVAKSMPPLAEALAAFQGFASGEKRGERMYELLREIISLHRGKADKRFYTLREVAAFFGVAIGTAETVYRRLSNDGVLQQMRSSQTVIPARAPRPRFAVRGVVAMPIWMPGFLQFQDWREWFGIAEEEFSRHHFVVEPVFFKDHDKATSLFSNRVLKFNPDYVLWFSPTATDAMPMLRFKDAGMPLITVGGHRNNFPGRAYPISTENAFRQGMLEWQKSGEIDQIVIAQEDEGFRLIQDVMVALQSCSLPHRIEVLAAHPDTFNAKTIFHAYLNHLTAQPRTGIIFRDDLFYTAMCNCVPDAMVEIFRQHRVMVERRVLTPSTSPNDYRADGVFFSWRRLARRIANDLDQAKGAIPTRQPVFHAQWQPWLPLREVIHSYPSE